MSGATTQPLYIYAAVMRNYGTPRLMLYWQKGELRLPRTSMQPEDWRLGKEFDPCKLAFLRAIRPFGLSTGMKYISEVITEVPERSDAEPAKVYTAVNISLSMHPKADVEWLVAKRTPQGSDRQWQFDLRRVDQDGRFVIEQYGDELVDRSHETA